MATNQWKAAVYLDQRATEDQRNALLKIFGGQAGGHPARLAARRRLWSKLPEHNLTVEWQII
jgi:hypothetical protein